MAAGEGLELRETIHGANNRRKIMIAMDRSSGAEKALEFALSELLRAGDDGDIAHICYGITQGVAGDPEKAVGAANDFLEELGAKCTNLGIHCETHVLVVDDVRDGLVDFASKLKPKIVVVGTRGLGSLKRAMLGSVSTYLIHHCEQPVLVIR